MLRKYPLFIILLFLQGCTSLPSKSNPEVFSTKQQQLSDGTLSYVFCTEDGGAWACPPVSKKTSISEVSEHLDSDIETQSKNEKTQNAPHFESVNHLASQDIVGKGFQFLGSVLFDFDSSKLRAKEKVKLIDSMESLKGREVLFAGYTDAVGGESDNHKLAVSRAKSAASFVEELGLPVTSYEVMGLGSCCYVSSNNEETGRILNRRVEIYTK